MRCSSGHAKRGIICTVWQRRTSRQTYADRETYTQQDMHRQRERERGEQDGQKKWKMQPKTHTSTRERVIHCKTRFYDARTHVQRERIDNKTWAYVNRININNNYSNSYNNDNTRYIGSSSSSSDKKQQLSNAPWRWRRRSRLDGKRRWTINWSMHTSTRRCKANQMARNSEQKTSSCTYTQLHIYTNAAPLPLNDQPYVVLC